MNQRIKSIITPARAGMALNKLSAVSPKLGGAKALKLFCTPQSGRTFTAKEEKFLSTAKALKIDYFDEDIQTYFWDNDGPIVLLAHGWDSNAARWRALVSALKHAGFSIVALDAPSHGQSFGKQTNGKEYAACLHEIMKHYNPSFAIGHSFGGMSLAYYLYQHRDTKLKKAILMATPSHLSTVINQYYEILGLSMRTKKSMAHAFIEKFEFDIDYFSVEYFIKEVPIEGLLIHDENDDVIPIQEAKQIHDNWNSSKFYSTEGLGHTLQSGDVFKKIVHFLKQ